MSAAPIDRDEKDDAPEPSRNPWVPWLVWVVVVPVLYALGLGPMCWLVEKHHLPEEAMVIYLPLQYLPRDLQAPVIRYIEWWAK
jgi:hypothetical protein